MRPGCKLLKFKMLQNKKLCKLKKKQDIQKINYRVK